MANLNLIKLYDLFDCKIDGPLNERTLQSLQEWGLIPREGTYLCPEGHPLKLKQCAQSVDGYVWRCTTAIKGKKKNVRCDVYISLRKDTFFAKSRLSIFKIVAFAYLWVKNLTLDVIMEELSISNHTASDWSSFCREVVYDGMVVNKNKIGGLGKVVEIDESKFGRRKYHRGHRVEGQWVFGGVERETNRCFLVPVEKRDKETLLKIIKDWILPGTIVVSDFWKAYDCLSEEGYIHFRVNHSIDFKDPDTEQHTNTIEGLWRHVKCSMPQYHRKKLFFNGYLAKFMFNRNCKNCDTDRLSTFLKMAGRLYNPCSIKPVEEEEQEEYEIEISL
ncbi:uncharacterized protein LOC118748792 [Rhagoletis pomonella]|uniref:uncharacterized protein LOC118748792 n=1 Tax=Rhagoletis pomonella TaxID=28610 RepID=UPI00178747B0|nr:uncharacterized protein LOC118748792 [Rhagoletis pomonella]